MLNIFKKAVAKTLSHMAEGKKLFHKGILSAEKGKHDQAIDLYSKSISIWDNAPAAFLNRGASYQIQERYLDAWDDYEHALDMETKAPSSHAKSNIQSIKVNMAAIAPLMMMNKEHGNSVRNQLDVDGLAYFAKRWAEEISKTLENRDDIVRYFILEELKELYDLGGDHRLYAANSSFNISEYIQISESAETKDAFILIKNILCCFSRNPKQMLEVRMGIISNLKEIINS